MPPQAFRDQKQELTRFSTSRSLPAVLRRKLLTYSLQEWSVNKGYDPHDMIKTHRIPTSLANSMMAAIYDDIVPISPLLRMLEQPVLHELLKFVKVVISLQKETLINQADPCTRLYILRQGSLQAAAAARLLSAASPSAKSTKAARQSTWKQKMQVRMIERPGDLICCRSPYEPPQPLPFEITSTKRSVLLAIHMQDLHMILDMVSRPQSEAICKVMNAEHMQVSRLPEASRPPHVCADAIMRGCRLTPPRLASPRPIHTLPVDPRVCQAKGEGRRRSEFPRHRRGAHTSDTPAILCHPLPPSAIICHHLPRARARSPTRTCAHALTPHVLMASRAGAGGATPQPTRGGH